MIYVVEDDRGIRELVVYTLQSTGFDAAGFEDAASFDAACRKEKPTLVLLDIMLPGEDGLSVLRRLRANPETEKLPVILVTAKGTEYDKVVGLDGGADDYIAKPFGMMELVSRVKALLRRTAPEKDEELYTAGPISLNVRAHTVRVGGVPVELTVKEFELLRLLMKREGSVLTRDGLLSAIWGYDFDGETRTVDVHIRTLRAKLGDAGDIIETVRGVGYRIGGDA
ncbi:MAG: response regulator transcription factor [Clostridiaceae bacterium]|nr:response regulator transcription factor [Clostridiaceae bacterium]